ncbi:MAG TPA: pyridoxamine 5'-phosphate oxidase [Gemmatimonadales bacterium]
MSGTVPILRVVADSAEQTLSKAEMDPDPIRQFQRWLSEAQAAGIPEPTAMTLATVDPDGTPSARTVLLKHVDGHGFAFFTNYTSRKATELAANPLAALVFFWAPLKRQVCIQGAVSRLSPAASRAYFANRPRGSQVGAWASKQSQVADSRDMLDRRVAEVEERYRDQPVPCPPFWGGFRLRPEIMEFWHGRESRLHDRFRYSRAGTGWAIERLFP